jgi:hypothetical protein
MGGRPCHSLASVEHGCACRQHLPGLSAGDAAGDAARGGIGRGAAIRAARIARGNRRLDGRPLRPAGHLLRFVRAVGRLGILPHGPARFYVPLAVCAALAVYTKESAFCLPLLPVALLPFLPRAQWRRAIAASLALGSVCAILFAYRWWALGGIGGYADRTGVSAVWHSRPLHTSEALLFRQWAFLFFPVNWSVPLEWWLRAAASGFLAMLVVYAARAGASARAHMEGRRASWRASRSCWPRTYRSSTS